VTTVGAYATRVPCTVDADEPLKTARRLMLAHQVRHLPVMRGGAVAGVLSEAAIGALEVLPGSSLLTAGEAMACDVYLTGPGDALDFVASEMARRRAGAAVVVTCTGVVGVFTLGEALQALVDALRPSPAAAA